MISPQETGYLATFTSIFFKKALIERVHWVDARIAVDPKQLGPCLCLRWPDAKWLNQHDKAWRLRSGEKSLSCSEIKPHTAKAERGWTGRGELMRQKNVPQPNTIRAAKDPPQCISCLSQSPGNLAYMGTSCPEQFSGASYWASKRR